MNERPPNKLSMREILDNRKYTDKEPRGLLDLPPYFKILLQGHSFTHSMNNIPYLWFEKSASTLL